MKEAEREALSAQLTAMEDWLYEDGEDEKKSVYVAKLAELKAKGDPIQMRATEEQARPGEWGTDAKEGGCVLVFTLLLNYNASTAAAHTCTRLSWLLFPPPAASTPSSCCHWGLPHARLSFTMHHLLLPLRGGMCICFVALIHIYLWKCYTCAGKETGIFMTGVPYIPPK